MSIDMVQNTSAVISKIQEDRCLIGIDLGATNVRAARISGGKIEKMSSQKVKNSDDPGVLLDQVAKLIDIVKKPHVEGIGVGVPSVVDVKRGIVYDVQNIPSWKEVHLKTILEEKFNIPTYVNNDANCFVLGEKYFGKARSYESVVGLTLGSGFGGGLVLNGQLYSGSNCGAGEVGMFPYKESIFEHYCSGMYFEREHSTSGEKVYEQALQGKKEALRMYEEFGTHLGNAIKVVMYAYDPEIIVLGGSISSAYSFFEHSMQKALKDFAYPKSINGLQIEVSELDHVAIFGAAALALSGKQV